MSTSQRSHLADIEAPHDSGGRPSGTHTASIQQEQDSSRNSGSPDDQDQDEGGPNLEDAPSLAPPSQTAYELFERLPGWNLEGVNLSPSKACLHGTREQLLCEIYEWVDSPDEKRILWLSGGAGTGKTSVAHSIAMFYDKLGRLGASFFANRDTAGPNNPAYLVGNVAWQLAHFHYHDQWPLMSSILSAISSMGHIGICSLQTQARKLIVAPTSHPILVEPVVIVIDALDEFGTPQKRHEILDAIATEFPKLHRSIKVIITSRDEPDIRHFLHDCSSEVLIDNAKKTEEDIASYVQHRLAAIQRRSHMRGDWPDSQQVYELVRRADGLFIWAATACNFVEEKRNPASRLEALLNMTNDMKGTKSPLEKLDLLYGSIFRNAFPDEDDPLIDFRYIVGSIIVLEAPLTQTGLDSLLGLGDGPEDIAVQQNGHEIPVASSYEIISLLSSIVRTDSTGSGQKELRLLHPSLYDFLTTRAEKSFRIEPLEQHHILAIQCLNIMNKRLRFDICRLGDPSSLNKDIKNLSELTKIYIPDGLRYACRSIGHHLKEISLPNAMSKDVLEIFVCEHLLHWIEVMSLLGEVTKAESCLQIIVGWIKTNNALNDFTQSLLMDAIPFLRNFGNVIRLSALHTYYSALPLMPKTTNLFSHFVKRIPPIPNVICSHPAWHPASLGIMEGHTSEVSCVAFSPDGRKLASASDDKTVRIWDVESVELIGEPLKGHTDPISYVVFSPDGRRLASASYDRTVRLWDVKSGQLIGETLVHTGRVFQVEFSPDGHNLASVSEDKLVWLWHIARSDITIKYLEGHTDFISHVVFSPDGKQLASASHDKTVRLWDVARCQPKGKPLLGHTDLVNYVVFSPDGTKLASASYDNTLKLWDPESGHSIGEPLEGHIDRISHLAFSPNGKMLASASDDDTVRLWDLQRTEAIGQILNGHTDSVRHVEFSPDGTKLASSSDDSSVRLWNVKRGEAIGEALIGHSSPVPYVIFSPDGTKLASASYDTTVRLWEVRGSNFVGESMKGHAEPVSHMVLSSDAKKLASVGDDSTVWLWDIEGNQTTGIVLKGHINFVRHAVFSPDGKMLASASDDKTVLLWDVKTHKTIGKALEGHSDSVVHIAFSPDGKTLASASHDRTVRLWSIESGQSTGKPLIGHTDRVFYVVFSPDGTKLASVSVDNMVRVWDLRRRIAIVKDLEGHKPLIRDLLFSSNGQGLVSVSHGNFVQLWYLRNSEAIGEAFKLSAEYYNPGRMNLVPELRWLVPGLSPATDSQVDSRDIIQQNLADKLTSATLSFDVLGFLQVGRTRLMWFPTLLRGSVLIARCAEPSLVAVGSDSGAISIIQFPR